MTRTNGTRALIAIAALAVLACQEPQQRGGEGAFDADEKPWKEIEARIPPYPRPDNLVQFEAGAASPHRFYVDAPSLSIGEDRVVRYTLVIRTAGGATNVTFEGIRCEGRQQKYYAVAGADRRWTQARNSQWRRIETQEVNRHHNVLYSDYVCSGGQPVRSVREILQSLRNRAPAQTD